jgi:ribosome maturation factor RimP
MITKDEATALIRSLLEGSGIELVQVQLSRGRKHVQIRVFIDRADGVTVADCAKLSHAISRKLEAGPEIGTEYRMEVSSAGMDRPIWSMEHFRRFQGERVQFELVEPREGRVRFAGHIESVSGERVRFRTQQGELIEVTEGDLAAANLELDPWKKRSQVRRNREAR